MKVWKRVKFCLKVETKQPSIILSIACKVNDKWSVTKGNISDRPTEKGQWSELKVKVAFKLKLEYATQKPRLVARSGTQNYKEKGQPFTYPIMPLSAIIPFSML